jgi:large subunit ribosomal protein L17
MHHNTFGKKLNRDTGQRQALLKGLAGALVRSEAIETTEAKAKAACAMIEKLITQARRASVTDIRQIETVIIDKDLIHKLVHEIAPRFKDRKGGFLRLIKLGNRAGDNAPMVRMEFVDKAEVPPASVKKAEK